MLDFFAILTRGGFLLWALEQFPLKGNPINALIQNCLLEERLGESSFAYKHDGVSYTLKWTMHNRLGLVFVAVYQSALSLLYVDDLLERVRNDFVTKYDVHRLQYPSYDARYRSLLAECERAAERSNKGGGGGVMQIPQQQQQQQQQQRKGGASGGAETRIDGGDQDDDEDDGIGNDNDGTGDNTPHETTPNGSAIDLNKLKALAKKKKNGSTSDLKKDLDKKKTLDRPKKEARAWVEKESKLDFTSAPNNNNNARDMLDFTRAEQSKMDFDHFEYDNDDQGGVENGTHAATTTTPLSTTASRRPPTMLSSMVQKLTMNVVGKSSLTSQDLMPVLEDLKRKLMERNVAAEIASKICDSVRVTLEGQPLASFTRASSLVLKAVEDALLRILTPKRSIHVLAEIQSAKARGQPYAITFVGVNGVGKSTNLAKIAYWLKSNNMSVMIAACDTFRSGAVEQLQTHCNRLGVPLFERGYEKDPAKVAQEAILQARRNKIDVVLIDTAGRMQDNEPLMRALANLISINKPDLVLFVGEALVGNDAVDQLTKFNQRLADLSTSRSSEYPIDGIVLTKFDTIDDKVGAALSMVYTSGAPIMFVGCGQTYVDLERLNVKKVVQSLLK